MPDADPHPEPLPPAAAADGLPEVSPDFVEQEAGQEIDNIVPTHGYQLAPMIGIGGSAGAIRGLQTFFESAPPDAGIVFVVILHLSPDHASTLAEMIQRWTPLPVKQAEDGEKALADHVYVIPPGKQLVATNGHFRLVDLDRPQGRRVAVDLFFRSLADTHGPHAAAIVLSGVDGDGAIGIKRIKERGGLTIAQDLNEAEHSGMPRSAIATGMVDWVLPAAHMPARIRQYFEAERRLRLPPEKGPQPAQEPPTAHGEPETTLREILSCLRARTGRDFSYYKRATILRRIARRIQVNGVEDMPAYLAFLRTHLDEPDALLKDLLISVTNFFRDRDAFSALEAWIPRLFDGKGKGDAVRVWAPACATGEEVYSMAMLLIEHASKLEEAPSLQVFGCDLDEDAIQAARAGWFPDTIAADVSEERLRRFFVKEHRGYRVRREVRETVLFATHDLLKDAPFSRLDLISCRNLLIYLSHEAQARVFEIFHFALKPGGLMFLGSSESVEDGNAFFRAVDKKYRLYAPKGAARVSLPLTGALGALFLRQVERQATLKPVDLEQTAPGVSLATAEHASSLALANPQREISRADGPRDVSWGEMHYKLIERFAPPSVLVDEDYDIQHLSESAGRFLQVAGGQPTANLLRLVHPALRIELRAALFRAAQSGVRAEVRGVPMDLAGQPRSIDILVSPAGDFAPGFLLVVFDAQEFRPPGVVLPALAVQPAPVVEHLERELEQLKRNLRDTVEQYEAGAEELKASNEELQAMNEELRSATEELETSREELQSINEELTTVNQELKSKVDELAHANSDLHNLMGAAAIATVFLDRNMRVMRFTHTAAPIFNLIASDIGRPLSDLQHQIDYPEIAADAARVLERLTPLEREVGGAGGRCFLARLLPYRTVDDRIGGVVLTFMDITERQQAQEALRESEARFRAVANLVPDLIWSNNAAGHTAWYNQRWLSYTGQRAEDAEGGDWTDVVHPDERETARRLFREAVGNGQAFRQERRLRRADGEYRWFLVRAEPVRDESGAITQWFGAATDIDDLKEAQAAYTASQERLRLIVENARDFAIISTDLDGRMTTWNTGAQAIFGYSPEEAIGQSSNILFTPEDRAAGVPEREARTTLAEDRAIDERQHIRKDGSLFWASGVMMAMHDADGEAIGLVKICRDQTEARVAQQTLERSREELLVALQQAEQHRLEADAAMRAKDHFLAVLSHELRTPLTPVLMAVHLLSRNRELPDSARDALEMIQRNVQIEAHFIDDLLDITRLSRGKLEIVRESMDLHQAVRHAVEISAADIEGKAQRLTVELNAAQSELTGDTTRLQQVFWNLLKNASKFTPEGGAIRVVSRGEPGRIVVEVSDDGVGFEAEAANRIFDAFAQADENVKKTFGGLGLGLAIAKATVDAHGGSLAARSAGLGQGAIFTVELPLT